MGTSANICCSVNGFSLINNCTMDAQEIKNNLISKKQWSRILFMLMFAVIYTGVFLIAKIIIILQILFALVAAKPNDNLLQMTSQLNYYIYDILKYLTYVDDIKPFPFASWQSSMQGLNHEHPYMDVPILNTPVNPPASEEPVNLASDKSVMDEINSSTTDVNSATTCVDTDITETPDIHVNYVNSESEYVNPEREIADTYAANQHTADKIQHDDASSIDTATTDHHVTNELNKDTVTYDNTDTRGHDDAYLADFLEQQQNKDKNIT
jgi:hypothetical protein